MGNLQNNSGFVLAADAGQVEEQSGDFQPMPLKDYIFVGTNADLKDTKDGLGKYVEIEFTIAQENGEFAGRKVFGKYNIVNRNQQAVNIAIGQLKSFCRVTRGELQAGQQFDLSHVAQGMGKPFIGRLANEKEPDLKGNIQQKVGSFKAPYDALNAPQQQQGGTAPPPRNNMAPPQQTGQVTMGTGGQQQGPAFGAPQQQAPQQQAPQQQAPQQQAPQQGGFTPPNQGYPNQ